MKTVRGKWTPAGPRNSLAQFARTRVRMVWMSKLVVQIKDPANGVLVNVVTRTPGRTYRRGQES